MQPHLRPGPPITMSNSTTLSMPPLDLADPVRRRHYFQGFATGILGGIIAAFVLPRLFRDNPADSDSASAAKPLRKSKFVPPPPASVPFAEPFSSEFSSSSPAPSGVHDPVPPIPFTEQAPDRPFPPYNPDSPGPNLPFGSVRTELPLRPDLPTRAARGSNGPANVSLSGNGSSSNGSSSTNGSFPSNGSSPSAGPVSFDPSRKTS